MRETNGKNMGTCLAITEIRPQSSGGCVGIFFKLFDWNRRFAKKKLFPKKLLPPARAKQASMKFGGDEKMPKTKPHLIADENSGGFPNVKKAGNLCSDIVQLKHEMHAPGLVARLMGLESMPAVHRDKHKKPSNSVTYNGKEEKFVNVHGGESDKEDIGLKKGNMKGEYRPQKLQKISQLDRRPVTRFGNDTLQINSVLSRSRKHHYHHHPKLASAVKTPRLFNSSRNASRASRLINAAARILEPGLLATSRVKCALTHSSSINYSSKDEFLVEGMRFTLPDEVKQQKHHQCASYNEGVGKSLMVGESSCENCGNLFDVFDSRLNVEDLEFVIPSSAPNFLSASSQGPEIKKPRSPIFSPEQGDMNLRRNPGKLFVAAEKQDNNPASTEFIADKKLPAQPQQPVRNQHCKPQKDEPSSQSFKQRTPSQNEIAIGRDRTPPQSKCNLQRRRASSPANAVSGTKDFVALNRNLSGQTPPRMARRACNSAICTERKFCSGQDDFLSQLRNPVRKRPTSSLNALTESSGVVKSLLMKPRNVNCDVASGKELAFNTQSTDHKRIKERSVSPVDGNRATGKKDNDVISFMFNSRPRPENSMRKGSKERRDQIEKNVSPQKKLILDKNDGKVALQKQFPLKRDALGALLEQKLKELISQEEDESMVGSIVPKKTTAMILQELILALTAEQPVSLDGHMIDSVMPFESEGKKQENDADHLSPGSVLEASFSNDSCFSSSMDDIIGHKLLPNSLDYSYDQPQQSESEADFRDSASSTSGVRLGNMMLTDLLNHVSRILQSINLAGGGLSGNKLTYAKEVILNAELLFGSKRLRNSDRMKGFLVGPFLLNDLEALAGAIWTNLDCVHGFEEGKEGNQLKKFLFDCVIEFLDTKYSRYFNSGLKAWRKVPLRMNTEMLICEVGEEVRKWSRLSRMILDEVIEWEMSCSLGKWMDFDIEAFETGNDIGWDILQILVEEIAVELGECRLGSLGKCPMTL